MEVTGIPIGPTRRDLQLLLGVKIPIRPASGGRECGDDVTRRKMGGDGTKGHIENKDTFRKETQEEAGSVATVGTLSMDGRTRGGENMRRWVEKAAGEVDEAGVERCNL